MADDLLSRTVLFAQTGVRWPKEPSGDVVREALTSFTVELSISAAVASRADVQLAAITFLNLVARYGCPIIVDVPPVPITLRHPLVAEGSRIDSALRALGKEINPSAADSSHTVDFRIAIGGTAAGEEALRIGWTLWTSVVGAAARMPPNDIGASFGPMIGANLAALEVFKAVLRQIGRCLGTSSDAFDRDAASAEPAFSLLSYDREFDDRGISPPTGVINLSETTFVSAGAMTSAALFGLVGVVRTAGTGRVMDPGILDPPDVNRYAFAFERDDGSAKAPLLAARLSSCVDLCPVSTRYEDLPPEERRARIAVVGVDQVPSRAIVQRDWPDLLLCGATQGPEVIVTRHEARSEAACCECIHSPEGAELPRSVPTLSAVSGLAGLVLAAELVKEGTAHLAAYRLPGRLHMRPLQLRRRLNVEVSRPEPRSGCSCGRAR